MLGQCDNLGGGVFKKRLNRNLARAIIVAKGGRNWVYAYLFEKKDKSNIDRQDLANLRSFAELFARKTETEIALELSDGQLLEICRDTES